MPHNRLLDEIAADFKAPANGADAQDIRLLFAELMDRCAALVHTHALDLDDVVLERIAVMRDRSDPQHREWAVPLPFLVHSGDWVAAFDHLRHAAGLPSCDAHRTEFVLLRMRILRT